MWRPSLILYGISVLSACAPIGSGPSGSFVSQADELVAQTQAGCEFIPTVAAIAALLSGGATASVGTIATQICAEVNKLPRSESDDGPEAVTVNVGGIAVDGLLF